MREKGFTLIELLIVIVIIAILAAVMIQIISPDKQLNQANDGTITSMVNKIILSTESFNSSYGRVPTEAEFLGSLQVNAQDMDGTQCVVSGSPDFECLFSVNGIPLPEVCDSNGWTNLGGNTEQCYFRYQGVIDGDSSRFRVYVKSAGLVNKLYTFDNKSGGEVKECPMNITDTADVTADCQ